MILMLQVLKMCCLKNKSKLCFLPFQVINAALTLAARPQSKVAQDNMDVFKDQWEKQVRILTEAVDDITSVDDFLSVSGKKHWATMSSLIMDQETSLDIYNSVIVDFWTKFFFKSLNREPHSRRCQQMCNCSTRRRCWHSGPNCRSHQGTSCSCSPHHQCWNGKLWTWSLYWARAGVHQASVWDWLVH